MVFCSLYLMTPLSIRAARMDDRNRPILDSCPAEIRVNSRENPQNCHLNPLSHPSLCGENPISESVLVLSSARAPSLKSRAIHANWGVNCACLTRDLRVKCPIHARFTRKSRASVPGDHRILVRSTAPQEGLNGRHLKGQLTGEIDSSIIYIDQFDAAWDRTPLLGSVRLWQSSILRPSARAAAGLGLGETQRIRVLGSRLKSLFCFGYGLQVVSKVPNAEVMAVSTESKGKINGHCNVC